MGARLEFKNGETEKKIRLSENRIGWLTSVVDKAGGKFDLTIRDGFGNIIHQKKDFGSQTERAGDLINKPVMVGEEVTVCIENARDTGTVNVFLD